MTGKIRFIAAVLLAAVGISALGGCIIVPDDGYGYHRHHDDGGGRGGDRDNGRDHGYWR